MLLEQEATQETPNTNQAIGFETAELLLQQQACGKLKALQPFSQSRQIVTSFDALCQPIWV